MRWTVAFVAAAACGRSTPAPVRDDARVSASRDAARVATLDHGMVALDAVVRADGLRRTRARDGATLESDNGTCTTEHGTRCHMSCMIAPDDASSPVLDGFTRALRDTPIALVRAAGLAEVAVCTEIHGDVTADAKGQDIGGTIDAQRHALLLSSEPMGLTGEEILHHELYHLFEHGVSLETAVSDPDWNHLNDPHFRYGVYADTQAGFFTVHGMVNANEDKATMYQYMMGHPDELCLAVGQDPIIAAKAHMIRQRIRAAIGDRDAAYLDRRAPCLAD